MNSILLKENVFWCTKKLCSKHGNRCVSCTGKSVSIWPCSWQFYYTEGWRHSQLVEENRFTTTHRHTHHDAGCPVQLNNTLTVVCYASHLRRFTEHPQISRDMHEAFLVETEALKSEADARPRPRPSDPEAYQLRGKTELRHYCASRRPRDRGHITHPHHYEDWCSPKKKWGEPRTDGESKWHIQA